MNLQENIHISIQENQFKNPKFPFHIDLQLFATAEDEGRTEEPSERRRREEREKGNVPRSSELPQAIVLLSSVLALALLSGFLFRKSFLMFAKYFTSASKYERFGIEELNYLFRNAVDDIFVLFLPVAGVAFLFSIAGNVVQIGFLFAPRALSFNFNKIVPNLKRVLPSRQTFFNLGKALIKVLVVGWISYIIISLDFYRILMTGDVGIKGALKLLSIASLKIFLASGILFLGISILDFYYQRYEFEESLKMTPSEAKQELKESEGDKTYLNRRRQMVREFIRKGMLQRVPKADVVVVNPTHYSVALSYDPAIHYAPVVVAKGVDELALLIRNLAKRHNVPIVEDRITARLLYEEVEIDQVIPAKFFRAVSVIIAKLDKYRRVA